MKKRTSERCTALLLALSLLLSLAACGNQAKATTMHLKRAEGTVAVSDDAGEDVPLLENLGLYSGYGVDTRASSFAWIDLDSVKLVKMDQESEVAIQKEDKQLEIEVKSGSLFFNVTQPLEDDETMSIRTSTMIVGIRGTCGWVEVPDASHMNVYLLEGKVECTSGETVVVMAGEVGRMDASLGTVTVEPFGQDDIPGFVHGELDGVSLDSIPETVEPEDPAADALEQYRTVLAQAETYFEEEDYEGDDVPTITYKYTLAQMRTESQIPALILEKETVSYWWGDICTAQVFQYDPDSDTVIRAEGTLGEGVASAGGYRGTLALAGDGIGILETSWSSGTGEGSIRRATVTGNALQADTIFDGFLFDETGPNIASLPIVWYDVTDLSGLDGWTPPEPAQPSAGEPEPAETDLPADGDRIVFAGTLGAYSYSEVLDLQNQADPNPGSDRGETYYLIVLDEPQTLTLRSGDGQGSRAGEVHLVNVSYAEGAAQYAGQHLTVSIDPDQTYWPSDTSLPLGEPSTSDIHILS